MLVYIKKLKVLSSSVGCSSPGKDHGYLKKGKNLKFMVRVMDVRVRVRARVRARIGLGLQIGIETNSNF